MDSLRLVPPRPGDGSRWWSWRRGPRARRYDPPDGATAYDLELRLRGAAQDLQDVRSTEFRWIVCLAEEAVGTIGLLVASMELGVGEISYLLAERHQGRRLGTRAVQLALAHIFAASPLVEIVAIIRPDNLPSLRLAQALGFEVKGTWRPVGVPKRRAKMLVYRLSRLAWLARQGGAD